VTMVDHCQKIGVELRTMVALDQASSRIQTRLVDLRVRNGLPVYALPSVRTNPVQILSLHVPAGQPDRQR
jgi:hypothetical protein